MQIQTMSVMSRDQLPNVLYRLKSDQIKTSANSQVHGGGGGGGEGAARRRKNYYTSLFFCLLLFYFFAISDLFKRLEEEQIEVKQV